MCKKCRRPLAALTMVEPESAEPLSLEARSEILNREIENYVRRGYRVLSRTDTTAQLVKPKVFSCLWFLLWALLLVGWIFYIAWYLSKRDETVHLEVTPTGRIRRIAGH